MPHTIKRYAPVVLIALLSGMIVAALQSQRLIATEGSLRADMSAQQLDAIRDGVVTNVEFNEAIENAAECMMESGVDTVEGWFSTVASRIEIVTSASAEVAPEVGDQALEDCVATHLSGVLEFRAADPALVLPADASAQFRACTARTNFQTAGQDLGAQMSQLAHDPDPEAHVVLESCTKHVHRGESFTFAR